MPQDARIWEQTSKILKHLSLPVLLLLTLVVAGDHAPRPFRIVSLVFAAGGTCPAGVPAPSCYFISAAGSDANSGTSESSPWLHAPGMPNCSSNCAALSAGSGGMGLIFRGGDTWHFGNSGATPYTGGTWSLYDWFGNAYNQSLSTCNYEGTQTGCLYVGVDPTWYSGSSWTRPVLTGDNPTLSGAGNFVSSCTYIIPNTKSFGHNIIVNISGYTIFDNFELTGLCVNDGSPTGDTYLAGWASSGNYFTPAFLTNDYVHGWTSTSTAGQAGGFAPVTIIGGGGGVQQTFDHIVIDGSDSNPEIASPATFPIFNHFKDSIVRYTGSQMVGQQCHDIHDVIWEHQFLNLYSGHVNVFECNSTGSFTVPNVFYNNILRHDDPSVDNAEGWWLEMNQTASMYIFNNLLYDAFPSGEGQPWAGGCGSAGVACSTPLAPFYYFNNTSVHANMLCYAPTYPSNAPYIYNYNNHIIVASGNGYDGSGAGSCNGGPGSATNVVMTDSTATSQGYTTGSSGTVGNGNTCANDSTTPCAPTASTDSTVGAGANETGYCTTLAGYTSDVSIATDAANACKYGTTDGCSYNATTHAMSCPAETPAARPASGAWTSGAYQVGGTLQAPTGLQATPH